MTEIKDFIEILLLECEDKINEVRDIPKDYGYYLNRRDDLEKLQVKLEALKQWQREALPFLKAECGNLSDALATYPEWEKSHWVNKDDFMTKELYEDIESTMTENHRILVTLIKQAEEE